MSQDKPKASRHRPAAQAESPRARLILDERTRRLAQLDRTGPEAVSDQASSVLLCPVGENLYGLPMIDVASLRPLERLSRTATVPQGGVMGLVADSGRVRQVLDLGHLLGAPATRDADGYLVMLKAHPDFALRLGERPLSVAVAPDPAHPERAQVAGLGDHHAKTLVILSVAALLAADVSVGA
ncbi:chemotaxis protein CheW [Phenylobacterium sp.]|uniref:chemotaxis protein CheW n=1 Tax=Phenylobacterium sp. TaxID=1871053 RepID=UPI00261488BD|nr:chemotaxis protein CheW [Phenylobacterium sp.]